MLKQFRKDKRAVAWVWIVGFFLTIPMCAVIQFALSYPFDLITEQLASEYTPTGAMASAGLAIQFIISYSLAFVIIYAVIWVVVNSKTTGGFGY